MVKKRIIICLTFLDGVLFRTKKFNPDYRYTKNFVDFWNIDELILIDISKKKFEKKFLDIVSFFSQNCFVPISVGGGIKDINHAELYFKKGSDKIILGFESFLNPKLLTEISRKFGNQSIIQSLDYKKIDGKYSLVKESGKETTNVSPVDFCSYVQEIGIGEILFNSVDQDGGLLGYDLNILEQVNHLIKCPKLILGGCGNWSHMQEAFINYDLSGACTQNIFHFTDKSIVSAKSYLQNKKIYLRK